MTVNLDIIPKNRRVAVRIPNIECGRAFLDAMRKQYPDKVLGWTAALFYGDYEKYDGGMCYVPHFESSGTMSYWSVNGAVNSGVQIIDWCDVATISDELPITSSEMSLEVLFG